MITRIKNGNVLIDGVFQKVDLFLDGKTIASIGTQMPFDQEVDAAGNYVTAGFIDLHCHGGGGADFSDGDVEGVLCAAKLHLQHGTTTLFPTALSADFDAIMVRQKAKATESDETIYWEFRDIIDFAKNHNALISIHAGHKSNGIDKEISNSLPVIPKGRRSTRPRWLSVPPETSLKPSSRSASANAFMFLTSCV